MIGSDDLSRLIQASLPLPGRNVDKLAASIKPSPSVARGGSASLSRSADASQASSPSFSSTDARNALTRALISQTLALSQKAPETEDNASLDLARPYASALAERIAPIEVTAPPAVEVAPTKTAEPSQALNPALSIIAAELTRTLSARSAVTMAQQTDDAPQAAATRTIPLFETWTARRLTAGAAAIAASALVVAWYVSM